MKTGATVKNAVLLEDVRIERGAVVRHAVLDKNARIGGEEGNLTLIGANVEVAAERAVEAGEHLEAEKKST